MPIAESGIVARKVLGARLRDDDVALVRRTQMGDERAFTAIFERHHAPLLSYCRHMLSNRDDGEDALQQTFIRAHRALVGGTTPHELRPWLYAIARNCCLSAIAARRPTAPLQDRTPALAGLSEEVRQREDLRELLDGIGRLPEDQRSALLLAELDDLSHQAIATVLGCPVSKVKALVYQARSSLIADRDARSTPCQDIREQLAVARGGELRRGPLRRHLTLCAGCRDFQLAVNAQRQSFASVLPVAPSAGLAVAILGHGSAHAAGAASIGGASAAIAPTGGASVASAGAAGAGSTATAGGGIAASAAGATSTAAAAGAGGGTSAGALLGSGLITKLALGGAVVALAAASTAAVHQHAAGAAPARVARARSASFAARASKVAGGAGMSEGTYYGEPALGSPAALTSAKDSAGSAGPFTGPSGDGGAEALLTLISATPPSMAASVSPRTAVKTGQSNTSENVSGKAQRRARAELRRAALRRRARRLRRARRRTQLRKALHKALLHRRHRAAPKPVKPPKPVTVTPAPARVRHRHARPTSTPISAPAETTAQSESNATKERHRHLATGTGVESVKATSLDAETVMTGSGKGKGKTGSPTATEKSTGTSKTVVGASGAEEPGSGVAGKSGVGADGKEPDLTLKTRKTDSGVGTDAEGTSATADAGGPNATPTHTGETSNSAAGSGKSTASHVKGKLLEERQLPNL